MLAVLVSGVMAELMLPERGALVVVKAVVRAAVGGVIGVYMMKNITERNLTELEA